VAANCYSAEGNVMLTKDQIEQRLIPWKDKYIALSAAYEEFRGLTGAAPDSKLMTPIFDMWEAYTDLMSETVSDGGEWLDWYTYECCMGATPMTVIFKNGKELEVATLRDLARVISEI
tara:strand:- start:4629 stop:4982 length:354 start_codon:yes stop_codon:yes gene_type:complete